MNPSRSVRSLIPTDVTTAPVAALMVVAALPPELFTMTPFLSVMCSLYVPGATRTVSIADAAFIAAWMVPNGDGTASTLPVPMMTVSE